MILVDFLIKLENEKINKIEKIKKLINESYKIANKHHKYCIRNCNYYSHNINCIELAKLHKYSFVNCNSVYCKDRCKYYNLTISHKTNKFEDFDNIEHYNI